jgi:hypothetical protein
MARTRPALATKAGWPGPPRLHGRPRGSAVGRCQSLCLPAGLTCAPPPPTPSWVPVPSPASRVLWPQRRRPRLRRGRRSPRGCPGLSAQAPRPYCSLGNVPGVGVEHSFARDTEAGDPGRPSPAIRGGGPDSRCQRAGRGRTGRPVEGRAQLISHASHVWGHPAVFCFLSPIAVCPLLGRRGQSGRGGAMPGPE